MRLLPLARFASIAGSGFLLTTAAGGAGTFPPASPPMLAAYSTRSAVHLPIKGRGRIRPAVAACSTSNSTSFVGILNESDVAGGVTSAVAGGASNAACDTNDGIGSGYSNTIGATGDGDAAKLSFIGSGQQNGITGLAAFVGAGEYNSVLGDDAFIGAGAYGYASGTAAFIGAGNNTIASGEYAFIGAGSANVASGASSAVAGGVSNTAGATQTFVGGGSGNNATGITATVAGGSFNTASATLAFVGGGANNVASGADSAVAGGARNSATAAGSFVGAGGYEYLTLCQALNNCTFPINAANGADSFVGAGDQNTANAIEAFVGGGGQNTVATTAVFGTIGGGQHNTVMAPFATIPGGADNIAKGPVSFAAGYHAFTAYGGSFVWSDYIPGSGLVHDTASNQFVVRASGGTTVYSSETLSSGVMLHAGSGTWASLSDRNAKTDITPLDDAAILAKVATLPVNAWRYKTEAGVRHVGPMAQDFYAAFHVGQDDRHITGIDEEGVALAAIKALRAENDALRDRAARGDARIAALERRVDALARRTNER